MKTTIVLVALICALGFFGGHPSNDASRQAAMDTSSPSAMM
jgi:hypothetical protein